MTISNLCYIVGSQKSGTTSLFDWLSQHEDVFAPEGFKDYPVFSKGGRKASRRINDFLSSYKSTKAKQAKALLGAEANLAYSPYGARRLSSVAPTCKVILILRNPEIRCWSGWRFARERLIESRSFEQAIIEEISGHEYPAESYEGLQMNYLEHSRYCKQVASLNNIFGETRVLLVPFETLARKPEAVVRQVCEFMGVDPNFHFTPSASNVTSEGSRSAILSRLLYVNRDVWYVDFARKLTTSRFRYKARMALRYLNRSYKNAGKSALPPGEVMSVIREELSDDCVLHEDLIRDFESKLNV